MYFPKKYENVLQMLERNEILVFKEEVLEEHLFVQVTNGYGQVFKKKTSP